MKLLRFVLVGLVVASVYVLLYVALCAAGLPQLIANALAFVSAVCLQYVGQARVTFGAPLRDNTQVVRFGIMVALGFVVSAIITGVIAPQIGLPDAAAAGFVAVLLPVQNYVLMTLWVFVTQQKIEG